MKLNKQENVQNTHRYDLVFYVLASFFIANAILAEVIGVKLFSFEQSIGIAPLDWQLWDNFLFRLDLSAGVMIWPIVFIISDLTNEYFGKDGVQRMTFMAIGLIAYAFVVIFLVTELHPADFWLKANQMDAKGNFFDINLAFTTLFRQSLSIIFASLTAFAIGQLLDAIVFEKIKKLTGQKMLWLRATLSTSISQFIDSFLILFLAFYMFGNWSFEQVIAVGIVQYSYKIFVAFLLIPVLNGVHWLIDGYLGLREK